MYFKIISLLVIMTNSTFFLHAEKKGENDKDGMLMISETLEFTGKLKKRDKGDILYAIRIDESESLKFLQTNGYVPNDYSPSVNIDRTVAEVIGTDRIEPYLDQKVKVKVLGGIRRFTTNKDKLVYTYRVVDLIEISSLGK